jgi:hypothetical protein
VQPVSLMLDGTETAAAQGPRNSRLVATHTVTMILRGFIMVKMHVSRHHTEYLLDGLALTKDGLMIHLRHRGIPPTLLKIIHDRLEGHYLPQQSDLTLYKPSEHEAWILVALPQ